MATYSDATVNVVSVSGSSAGTHYTVPAGRRAKVYVQEVTFIGGSSLDSVSFGAASIDEGVSGNYNFPNDRLNQATKADVFLASVILLNAGDTITTTATATVDCVVEEYTNP